MIEQSRKTANRPVEQAISYLNRSFASPDLSVSSLAAMLGISEAYLRKLFYAQVGVSPHRYIAGLRLQHATQLLQSGYYTVEETAVLGARTVGGHLLGGRRSGRKESAHHLHLKRNGSKPLFLRTATA